MEKFELGKTRATKKQVIEGNVSRGIVKLKAGVYAFNYYFLTDDEEKVEYTTREFKDSTGTLKVRRKYKKWLKVIEEDFFKNEKKKSINKKRLKTRKKSMEKLWFFIDSSELMNELMKDWENSTYNRNMNILKKLRKENIELFNKHISDVNISDINHMLNKEITKVSRETLKKYKFTLVKIFDIAEILNLIEEGSNPARKYKIPKKKNFKTSDKRDKRNILNVEEEKIVIQEMNRLNYFYQVVFKFALLTGLRNGEIYGIEWGDISWEASTITIHQVMTEQLNNQNGMELKQYTKTGESEEKPRIIPLYAKLKRLLEEYKKYQDYEYKKRNISRADLEHDFIFCKSNSDLYKLRRFSKKWHDFILELNEEGKINKRPTFHNLRGTYISRCLINQKMPPTMVQEMAGHSSSEITLNYYVNVSELDIREVSEKYFR